MVTMITDGKLVGAKPGPAIQLTYNTQALKFGEFDPTTYTVYTNEDFTINGGEQDTMRPLEILFKMFKEGAMVAADKIASGLGTAMDMATKLSDIFGIRIGGKGFYAQSWAGAKPSSLSIVIKLYNGIADVYNAKLEVYEPAMSLLSRTVPRDGNGNAGSGGIMSSPIPNGIDVIVKYSADLLSGLIGPAKGLANGAIATSTGGTSLEQAKAGIVNKVWDVSAGFWDGREFSAYVKMPQYIVTNSSVKFSKEVQKVETKFFPMRADITLSMISQEILTTSNIAESVRGV